MPYLTARLLRCILCAVALLALPAAASTLHISVAPQADGRPLLLDSLRYETAEKETYSISRCSFLLSGATRDANGALRRPSIFAPKL